MTQDIETSFQTAVNAGKINGAVLCATDSRGRFTYSEAIGKRTLLSGEEVPQQLDDVLYLASATKIVTTIAALQCVDDGLLTLDGDLSSIVPELTGKKVLIDLPKDHEEPILETPIQAITLKMLLTHSSGIVYDFLNSNTSDWRKRFDSDQDEGQRPVEDAFKYPLAFQPGTNWMYGPGLDWAGRIVEKVTGQTLGQHMQQRICAPLDINSGHFYPVTRDDLRARLVDLNPQDPNAFGRAVVGGGDGGNKRSQGDFGGHGLFISGDDFLKVLHSILVNDGKLLKSATVDSMFEHHLSKEATIGHRDALISPMGVFFRVGIDSETKAGHGLGGLLTLEDANKWYGERTLTWGGGLTLTWFIDRKKDLCGVGAVQAKLPDFDGETVAALKQTFRRDIYRKHDIWKEEQGK